MRSEKLQCKCRAPNAWPVVAVITVLWIPHSAFRIPHSAFTPIVQVSTARRLARFFWPRPTSAIGESLRRYCPT